MLTLAGSGTTTLSGLNTYTGATAVLGGTLNLTGSIASSVAVYNGADPTEGTVGVIGGGTTNFTLAQGTATLAGPNTYGRDHPNLGTARGQQYVGLG